jgi:hypothetical protein
VLPLVTLFALKALVDLWALRSGFTHVSDDDYARVVIAETFAASPRLDPSGTSWLPLPFWLNGAAMALFGRSLDTARAVAIVIGIASVAPPFWALRAVGVPAWRAAAGIALGAATPWSAWLGVATVPEAMTGSLVATAAILLATPQSGDTAVPVRARAWAAAAALAASLSRYEAWPVCAVVASVCAWDARRDRRALLWCGVALAGPILWSVWNAHAHGDALHFIARVTAFRRAHGFERAGMADKLFGFPRALVTGAPEIALLALAGAIAARRDTRSRWVLPLAACAATLAFLIYGDLHDGAPTHHPERALLGVWMVLAAFGADATGARFSAAPPKRAASAAAPMLAAFALFDAWGAITPPGTTPSEDRTLQVARGLSLRPYAIRVAPCKYEHFALLAAYGAPERAEVRERSEGSTDCPAVELR